MVSGSKAASRAYSLTRARGALERLQGLYPARYVGTAERLPMVVVGLVVAQAAGFHAPAAHFSPGGIASGAIA